MPADECALTPNLDCADNGAAGVDLGEEELDVAAWGEPELDLDAEENGVDEDGLEVPEGAADEEGGWEMEVLSLALLVAQ